MKKNVLLIILLIILILTLGIFVFIKCDFTFPEIPKAPQVDESGDITEDKYAVDIKREDYSARILEAENNEYVTLYIETNIFENEKEVLIKYDNAKYILNTANILLENVEISKTGNINSFKLKISQRTNYNISFIKKAKENIVEVSDIVVENIAG